jgi:4-hydroxy-tetrahydrodipicolinate synthase
LYEEGNPVGIKVVLSQLGICEAHVRQPLQKASEGLMARIREAMA